MRAIRLPIPRPITTIGVRSRDDRPPRQRDVMTCRGSSALQPEFGLIATRVAGSVRAVRMLAKRRRVRVMAHGRATRVVWRPSWAAYIPFRCRGHESPVVAVGVDGE